MSRLTESVDALGSADAATDRVLDRVPERASRAWHTLGPAFALFVGVLVSPSLLYARFTTTGGFGA